MNIVVIALVASTCIIFLLVNFNQICQQCYGTLSKIFSRTRGQRRVLIENQAQDPSLDFQSRGLDSFITHSLPITQFKKKSNEEELGERNTECAVCLGEFEEGECLKHLPYCSHAFHASCIDTWFQNHSSCPLCRSQICGLTPEHDSEYSVSMYTMLEAMRREDFLRERLAQYQVLHLQILENSSVRASPENAN